MSHSADIPKPELIEMISAFAGVVTALTVGDQSAADQQLMSIIDEQVAAADGDGQALAFRMLKQIEAGARFNVAAVRTLANRLDLDEVVVHEVFAQAFASLSDEP